MDTEQLLGSFEFRFKAAGVRKPERVSEELMARVFSCSVKELHAGEFAAPKTTAEQLEVIRALEEYAVRLEKGESPQDVLNCLDF